MAEQPKPFWIVYAPHARLLDQFHHEEAHAYRGARQLAADHPGLQFFVLRTIAVAQSQAVTVTEINPPVPS